MKISNWAKKQLDKKAPDAKGEYTFKLTSPHNYEAELKYTTVNSFVERMFSESKKKLIRKPNMQGLAGSRLDRVERFEIDKKFYNQLHTICNSHINQIEDEVGEDGINLVSSRVTKAYFVRADSEHWFIRVTVEGSYEDERRT